MTVRTDELALAAATPPFGTKRKAAMAIYSPPFRFMHGYIYDSKMNMVADQGGFGDKDTVERAVALQIRGWGRIGYMPNAKELQDEVGAMCVDALNAYYATHAEPAPQEPPPAPDPVEGDLLPPIGSSVLIHLGRQDEWVKHTVTGYYVWGDLGGNSSLHRVNVRVVDDQGYPNARPLKDVRPTPKSD